MSNEYKDHMADLRATFNEKMWEIEFLYDGWLKTFVPQMMDELFDALGSYVEDFEVLQIKEKFGRMRLYWGWADRDYTDAEAEDLNKLSKIIDNIIAKYENISGKTCIECVAKPHTLVQNGYVRIATRVEIGLKACLLLYKTRRIKHV